MANLIVREEGNVWSCEVCDCEYGWEQSKAQLCEQGHTYAKRKLQESLELFADTFPGNAYG
jgi:hypothetical protein